MIDASPQMPARRQAIEDLIRQSCLLLDSGSFDAWLDCFAADGVYELSAFASELRRPMSWWKADRPALSKTLAEVPKHVRDMGTRLHMVSPSRVRIAGDRAEALSTFAVYRTSTDGDSALYAVGHYEDTLVDTDAGWRFAVHKVVMQTRVLAMPTHVPI